MNEGFQFLDIIFLAMLAGFIALRLRSVLGRRTGHERRPDEANEERYPGAPKQAPQTDDVGSDAAPVNFPAPDYRLIMSPSSPAFDGVEAIRRYDRDFHLEQFVAGARGAYEMILTSFWSGDREEFRPFVSDDVYAQFDAAIRMRVADGESLKNTLERVRHAEIIDASLNGALASITIRFVGDAILMTLDREGRIIAGDPQDTVEVKDEWTFERNLDNQDPNWTLVATHSVGP